MIFAKKAVAFACVAVAMAALSAFAQKAELNPTVKVLARPQSPVPAECATVPDTTSPALEPQPQPATEPVIASAPPSNNLRASLRRTQVAAEGDDYAAFKAAYAESRRASSSYPAGGERNAANDALQVYADLARIWDYAMASPTGSFFDATVQGGSLLTALKRYPDFGRTIAGQTFTAGGMTLYPTRETRRFLATESAQRLAHLGVSTPTRIGQDGQPEPWPLRKTAAPPADKKPAKVAAKSPAKTPETTTATPKTAAKVTPKTTPKVSPKTAEATSSPKAHETKHKPSVKTARTETPKPKTPHIESTPVPKEKPALPLPVKTAEATTTHPVSPVPVTSTTAAPPPPVPTTTTAASTMQPATTTTAAPAVSTTTSPATTTAAPSTDTTTTAAPSASTTAPAGTTAAAAPDTATTGTAAPAPQQNGNMNLILAIVLILVGIGVLVVLFRASD